MNARAAIGSLNKAVCLSLPLALVGSVSMVVLAIAPAGTFAPRLSSFSLPGMTLVRRGGSFMGLSVSGDGRYVLTMDNWRDVNPPHLYVTDMSTGSSEQVDVNSAGVSSDGYLDSADISSDGRYVFFISSGATDLVPSPMSDLYMKDLTTGQLTNLTITDDNQPVAGYDTEGSMSPNGRYLVFTSTGSNVSGNTSGYSVYEYDRQTGAVTRVTDWPDVQSGDYAQVDNSGDRVVFEEPVPYVVGGFTYYPGAVFLRDLSANTMTDLDPPSCSGCGSYGPKISADGRYVAFDDGNESFPGGTLNNGTVRFDVATMTRGPWINGNFVTCTCSEVGLSADGSTVSFAGWSNDEGQNAPDPVFVVWHAATNSQTYVGDGGGGANNSNVSALSDDGSVLAFDTAAANMIATDTDRATDTFEVRTDINNYALDGPSGSALTGGGTSPAPGTQSPCSADPVDTQTGALIEATCDLKVPGRGIPLDFRRSYDSKQANVDGPLGYGWTDSYAMSLSSFGSTTDLIHQSELQVTEATGAQLTFDKTADGTYQAARYVRSSLAADATGGGFTYTRPGGNQFHLNANGRLIAETDRNGYTTTLSYDGNGRLATVTEPAGRQLILAYNSDGTVASISDTSGRTVTYGYDTAGNLATVTDANGAQTQFGYDGSHHLTTMTDPRGHTTTNVYDGSGRVVSQTDRAQRVTTFAYTADPAGRANTQTVTVTDPRGIQTVYNYVFGLLLNVTRAAGTTDSATTSYTYDGAVVEPATVTDPLGHTWTYSYDGAGNPTSICDPLAHCVQRTFNSFDEPLTITDPTHVTTTNSYDGNGNLLSTATPLLGSTPPVSRTIGYTYGDATHPGDVTAITDPRNKTVHFGYDQYGQLTSSTDAAGDESTYAYTCTPSGPECRSNIGWVYSAVSPRGNAAGVDPAQFTTRVTRDDDGRVLSVTDPLGQMTSYGYDGDGNRTSMQDANHHTTGYNYDNDNELTTVTRADSSTLQTGYDADGNMISQTDGAHHATTDGYDALNRRISMTTPPTATNANGITTSYTYDAASRLHTMTAGDGAVTSYGYDAGNRLTSISYSDGTTPAVSYSYDEDNRRTAMSDGTGPTGYTYDSLGRLTDTIDGAGQHVGYGYDLAGDVTSITYPNGKSVTRGFDDAGRLHTVSDWNASMSTFGYNEDGTLTSITYPNGVVEATGVDPADRATAVTDTSGTTSIASYNYGRDADGLLTSTTPTGPTGQTNETYGHSSLNQLTSYSTATTSGSYGYNAADDLTGLPDGTSQTFDAADEITGLSGGPAGVVSFSYNARGDRTTMTTTAGAISYGYDQADRLTSFHNPGGTTASYTYNGDSLRATKTVGATSNSFSWDQASGSVPLLLSDGTTNYIYGPNDLPIEQLDDTAIQLVGTDTATSTGVAATMDVHAPAGIKAGDLILIAVSEDDLDNTSATGFSRTSIDGTGPNRSKLQILRKRATGAEGTITLTTTTGSLPSVTVHPRSAVLTVYRGVDAVSPYEAETSTANASLGASVTVPSASAAAAPAELVFLAGALNDPQTSPTWTVPAGSTQQAVATGQALSTTMAADRPITSAGPVGSDTAALNTSTGTVDGVAAWKVILRPADPMFLLHDQQGSTRILTNSAGAVAGTYAYDPYGNTVSHTGSRDTSLQYAGQYRDMESGLYYLRARYYDTATGQFLTRDPADFTTHSPYNYASDDPVNQLDRTGLSATDVGGGPWTGPGVLPPLPSDYIPWNQLFALEMGGCLTDSQYEHYLAEEQQRREELEAFAEANLKANLADRDAASLDIGQLAAAYATAAVGCASGAVGAAATFGPTVIVPVAGQAVAVGSSLAGCAVGTALSQVPAPVTPEPFPDSVPNPPYVPRHAKP